MATPIIRSSASTSGVITGVDRNDLDIGETVTLTDTEAANVGAVYQWTLEDKPIGSSTTISNPTTATASFIPDQTGTYRIRCTVNGTAYEVAYLAVPLPVTGARIPSYLEDDTSGGGYNAGGNTKGWHESQTAYMRAVDSALTVATFPGYGVVGNMSTLDIGDSAAAGGLATVARADHQHVFPSPTVINDVLGTASTLGTSTKAAREDHSHFHGTQTVTTLHALATTGAHGFMAAADKAATIITVSAEASLANSRRLVAGANITLDVTVAGVLTINSSGGGGGYVPGGANRIPFANSGGTALTDSADFSYLDATNELSLSASDADNVGFTVSNTANTSLATASFEVNVGGTGAGDPRISLGVVGGKTWNMVVSNVNSDRWELRDGSTARLAMVATGLAINAVSAGGALEVKAPDGAAALSRFIGTGAQTITVYNTNNSSVDIISHPHSGAGTLHGINTAGLVSVAQTNDSGNSTSMLVGTAGARPLYLSTSSVSRLVLTSNGNVAFGPTITSGADATTYGGGVGIAYRANATTVPTTNPTAGFLHYSEGGVPKWRDAAGNILTIGSSGANSLGTYIVQIATNAPANAQILASLGTGIVKNTTTTGVLSIAAASDLPSVLTTKGDISTYSTVPARLAVGTNDHVLIADSAQTTGNKWGQIATAGITDAAVTAAKMFSLAGASVLGRSANSTGVMAAITGATIGHVLTVQGDNTLAFSAASGGGFTPGAAKRIPFGNSGATALTDSADFTYDDTTNDLSLSVAESGGAVGFTLSNTSNTASSTARATIRVAGTSAGSAGLTLGITGGADWSIDNVNATSGDPLEITQAGNRVVFLDPTGAGAFHFQPSGANTRNIVFSYDLASGLTSGPTFENRSTTAGTFLNIFTTSSNTTGGVGIAMRDTTAGAYKYALSVVNRAGPPNLLLVENGGNTTIGGMTVPTSINLGLCISNGTAPGSIPASGVAIWAEGGVLKAMGGSGVPITLAS